MKALLFPFNLPIPPLNGAVVTKESAAEAIRWTMLPLPSWVTRSVNPIPEVPELEQEVRDDCMELQCTKLFVEEDGMYGELDFISPQSRPLTHPDEYRFFARIHPRQSNELGQPAFNIEKGVLVNFFFSSIGFERK